MQRKTKHTVLNEIIAILTSWKDMHFVLLWNVHCHVWYVHMGWLLVSYQTNTSAITSQENVLKYLHFDV